MKSRRILAGSIFAALTVTMVWCAVAATWQRGLSEDMVRLRVVASSDDAEDQAAKLLVRDAVLEQAQTILAGETDAAKAAEKLNRNLNALTEAAQKTLLSAGKTDTARAYLTWESTGSRDYGTFSLPAGRYVTLRVDIGGAQGHNWWCVVFPPVCAAGAEEAVLPACLSDSERAVLAGAEDRYILRFRTLEILRDVEEWLEGMRK